MNADSMPRPLRVLAIAYACNPDLGSEEGVGWGWVHVIARRHEVDVITAAYHRADIQRSLAATPETPQNIRFHYVPERPWHYRPSRHWKFIENSWLKPIMNLVYVAWQRDAYRLACRLHDDVDFDLIHLITYVGYRFPGRFWQMDIPLVWGPIGGLENTPWRFLPSMGLNGSVYYACRNTVNSLQKRFLPGPKRSFTKAAGSIVAATEGIRKEIRCWYGHDSHVISEIGPPREIAARPTVRNPNEPLRLIWSGRHLPGKELPLLLHALSQLDGRVDWRLTVVGSGPRTRAWKRCARRLGVAPRCTWRGWLARHEAVRAMAEAHACVITSMKDLTSTVLLEALANGLPVICPDHCGFANVVTPDCGIKVPVQSPGQLIAALAGAIEWLAANENERRRLAAGALRRIGDFSWENKAHAVAHVYRRAMERTAPSAAGTIIRPGDNRHLHEVQSEGKGNVSVAPRPPDRHASS